MDILIHGIEMPKDGCGFLMAFTLNEKGEWLCAKMNECKWRTVNVLPPHGRLIDADELMEKMLNEGDKYTNEHIGHGYHNCQLLVYDAPTVIETED